MTLYRDGSCICEQLAESTLTFFSGVIYYMILLSQYIIFAAVFARQVY